MSSCVRWRLVGSVVPVRLPNYQESPGMFLAKIQWHIDRTSSPACPLVVTRKALELRKIDSGWYFCLISPAGQPARSSWSSMAPEFLRAPSPTSICSNFAANNFQKQIDTTMSDVKSCQESIPRVFIAWKSTYSDLFAGVQLCPDVSSLRFISCRMWLNRSTQSSCPERSSFPFLEREIVSLIYLIFIISSTYTISNTIEINCHDKSSSTLFSDIFPVRTLANSMRPAGHFFLIWFAQKNRT